MVAPLAAIGPAAGLRAASRVPRGVEEAVMLAMEEGMVLSEAVRGGEDSLESEGLARSGEASSSGEVGGDGDSSGLVISSLESDMAAAGGRRGPFERHSAEIGDGVVLARRAGQGVDAATPRRGVNNVNTLSCGGKRADSDSCFGGVGALQGLRVYLNARRDGCRSISDESVARMEGSPLCSVASDRFGTACGKRLS